MERQRSSQSLGISPINKMSGNGRQDAYRPVPLRSGKTELIRIFFGPYSAARPLVALATAALLALYHTRPGRGLVAPIEAILIIEPPSPWLMRLGMKWRDD